MGVFDFFKGGEQRGGSGPEPQINKETRTYDELIDEITEWNIDHTDIIGVLRNEIQEERLVTWSRALEVGVRKGLASPRGREKKVLCSPFFLISINLSII